MSLSIIVLVLFVLSTSLGLEEASFYAYDCENPIGKPVMFSLLDSGECPLMETEYKKGESSPILVVQSAEMVDTDLLHCDVTYSTVITRCGFNSLTYGSSRPDYGTRLIVSAEECRKAFHRGEILFHGQVVKLPEKRVGSTSLWLHGFSDFSGNCKTESFSWNGDRYDNSYMQVHLRFRITHTTIQTPITSEVIKLPGNVVCPRSEKSCQDGIEGTFVWKVQDDECREKFQRVYMGEGVVHQSRDEHDDSEIITIADEKANRYAGLFSREFITVCGHRMRKTQSEYLFYLTGINLSDPPRIGRNDIMDIRQDIFLATSVGYSSFSTQLSAESSVTTIQREVCNIYRKQLQDKLVAIRHHPDGAFLEDWGFNKTRLDLAGAAMSAAMCRKVAVSIRSQEICTQEIPVKYNDTLRYVDPTTFQLKRNSTRTICSHLAPIMWKIGARWWCSLPDIIECLEPRILDPTVPSIESFHMTTDGVGQSIYTPEDMKRYQERQIFHDNRETIDASLSFQQQYGGSNDSTWRSFVEGSNYESVKEKLQYEFFPHIAWMGDFGGMFAGITFFIALFIFLIQAGSRAFFILKTEGISWKLVGIAGETLMLLIMFPLELMKTIHQIGKKTLSPFPTLTKDQSGKSSSNSHEDERGEDRRSLYNVAGLNV